jgi:hypothetical protein
MSPDLNLAILIDDKFGAASTYSAEYAGGDCGSNGLCGASGEEDTWWTPHCSWPVINGAGKSLSQANQTVLLD